jgi:hypothetical protein
VKPGSIRSDGLSDCIRIEQRNWRSKNNAPLCLNFLTKKAPYKGLKPASVMGRDAADVSYLLEEIDAAEPTLRRYL